MFGFGKKAKLRDALLTAASDGNLQRIGELLAEGADVNARDGEGFTPLIRATRNRHVDAVKLLLDKGADPNARSKDGTSAATLASPLFHETRAPEYIAILKLLIAKGINSTIRGQVTMVAQMVGIPEVLRLF